MEALLKTITVRGWRAVSAACVAALSLLAFTGAARGQTPDVVHRDFPASEATVAETFGGPHAKPAETATTPGQWDERFDVPGIHGVVSALAVDSNRVYVAGGNSSGNLIAGDLTTTGIAAWDSRDSSWSALGKGIEGYVNAIALHEGNVYVGGGFSKAGGKQASNIAKWDGTEWIPLGEGTNDNIQDIAIDADGDIYVGGNFTAVGGEEANYVARWDGSTWSSLGSGVRGQDVLTTDVEAVVVQGSTVYVGGHFIKAGEKQVNHVARWDGNKWTDLNGGLASEYFVSVRALAADKSGRLYVGGEFNTAGEKSVNALAMWDGEEWKAPGGGRSDAVSALAITKDGTIYVGGSGFAKWDGKRWIALDVGIGVDIIAAGYGKVYIGESSRAITPGGSVPTNLLRRKTDDGWSVLGCARCHGVTGTVRTLAARGDVIYAGGEFGFAGSMRARQVARWNGARWDTLGAGLWDAKGGAEVRAVAVADNGDVYVGGRFSRAGTVETRNVARWDGERWHALGEGVGGEDLSVTPYVDALALRGQTLYVGGYFTEAGSGDARIVARWNRDDEQWSPMGGGMNSQVLDFELTPDGALYAAGAFDEAGGKTARSIARWDGTTWHAVGQGVRERDSPAGLAYDIARWEGRLYAAGIFTRSGNQEVAYLARWNGGGAQATWGKLGGHADAPAALVDDLPVTLRASEEGLFVGGHFDRVKEADSTVRPLEGVAFWDGRGWRAVGGGVEVNQQVRALTLAGDDLYVGGDFIGVRTTGGATVSSLNFARYENATSINVKKHPAAQSMLTLQVAPNPFRQNATIHYRLERPRAVRLAVYDVLGRRVRVLRRGQQPAGTHRVELEARGLAAGTYLCRLIVEGRAPKTTTIVLTR